MLRADFKHVVESRCSEIDAITMLRTILERKSLQLIQEIECDYIAAWEHTKLIHHYTDFHVLVSSSS